MDEPAHVRPHVDVSQETYYALHTMEREHAGDIHNRVQYDDVTDSEPELVFDPSSSQ